MRQVEVAQPASVLPLGSSTLWSVLSFEECCAPTLLAFIQAHEPLETAGRPAGLHQVRWAMNSCAAVRRRP